STFLVYNAGTNQIETNASAGGTIGLYDWNEGGLDEALDIDDYFMSGDLGNPDRETWANRTRIYLDNPDHADVNVVMWSWCGQASTSDPNHIQTYLTLMTSLENDYPNVIFVYMTGHTDGTGLEEPLHQRNSEIRNYCIDNGKILFDFADIESYDPDGNYYGDKFVDDGCYYHNDTYTGNWADEWTTTHEDEVFSCGCAHSKPLNCNMKAYAAWWLWAKLAGWEEEIITSSAQNLLTKSSSGSSETSNTFSSAFNPIIILMGVLTALTLRRRVR
ncbi:MAG: hypothetical protein ACFFFH_21655, partial [Candidatus Thorarchaeota archaeon]